MMGYAPLLNRTRLFFIHGQLNTFLPRIQSWRIMWHHGKNHRVILRERVTVGEKMFLQEFPEGCTLDLLGGNCRDMAQRDEGVWLYRFVDCKVNRSWIRNVGALSPNEMEALTFWLEIDCTVLTFMQDLKVDRLKEAT